MASLRLRIAWAERDARFPRDDDALGFALHDQLLTRLRQGHPRPTAVCLRAESAQLVDLVPVLASGAPDHWLAALAGQDEVEAFAVVAILTKRRRGLELERCAATWVEWPDGRWWFTRRLLDAAGRPVPEDEPDVLRAVDGATKPMGIGGWFARARFHQIRLRPDPAAKEQWN